jgi:DNA modification methylase
MSSYQFHHGNVLRVLRGMADQSVNCCVTSPPYYGLRDYNTAPEIWGGDPKCQHEWGEPLRTPWANDVPGPNGGAKNGPHSRVRPKETGPFCSICGAWRGSLGLEPTPDLFVQHLVEVFREVRRVLKNDGTLWLNLGDSYAGSWGNQGRKEGRGEQRPINGPLIQPVHDGRYTQKQSNTGKIPDGSGLKPKDLIGIPWMAAFALRADGWYLRSEIIWAKVNCMPESMADRPTKAHEQLFLLSKEEQYFYNADAIREPFATDPKENYPARAHATGRGDQLYAVARGNDRGKSGGFPPASHKGSSFHRGKTGANGMGRVSERERGDNPLGRNKRSVWFLTTEPYPGAHFAVMPEKLVEPCILAGCPDAGTVLDPFVGSGTVGAVSLLQKRNFIGIDLNADYVEMARTRLYRASSPLLGDAELVAI